MESPPISSSTSPTPSLSSTSTSTVYADRDRDDFAYSSGRSKSGGLYTPGLSRNINYEQANRQSYSESSLSLGSQMDTPKRRATSPTSRMREQPRKVPNRNNNSRNSMMVSGPYLAFLDKHGNMGDDASRSHYPLQPHRGGSGGGGSITNPDHGAPNPFWNDSEDTVEVLESYKRPKNEERGTIGRNSRAAIWTASRAPPPLRRESTSSHMAGLTQSLTIKSKGDDKDEDGRRSQPSSLNNSIISFGDEPTLSETLVKTETPCRRPLQDISVSKVVTDTDISMAPSFGHDAFGPLTPKYPTKVPKKPKLVVVNPFPENEFYWTEYANDSLDYLQEVENRHGRYNYLLHQQGLLPGMRLTLVEWLIEMSYGVFCFQTSTLHCAVHIMDRYLSMRANNPVPVDKLQCAGLCSLMIAGKLDENVKTFSTSDLTALCLDAYTKKEIALTELDILVSLNFDMVVATSNSFAEYFKRAIPEDPRMTPLVDFLCDLSLVSDQFLPFTASRIAAAALFIAVKAGDMPWTLELAELTRYSSAELGPCLMAFKDLIGVDLKLDLRFLGARYQVAQSLDSARQILL